MNLPPIIKQLDTALLGYPDHILTAILFAISSIGVVVALFGPPSLKAAFAAWFIAP